MQRAVPGGRFWCSCLTGGWSVKQGDRSLEVVQGLGQHVSQWGYKELQLFVKNKMKFRRRCVSARLMRAAWDPKDVWAQTKWQQPEAKAG